MKTGRKNKTERNAELVSRYLAGDSTEELQTMFKITRARIYQILKEAGISPERQQNADGRDQFLGVNLSEPVKDALRAEAQRRGLSMSALTSGMLRDMLVACGYPLEAEKVVQE